MAETDSVRIEIAFDGGPIVGANVTAASADALERAVAASAGGTPGMCGVTGVHTTSAHPGPTWVQGTSPMPRWTP